MFAKSGKTSRSNKLMKHRIFEKLNCFLSCRFLPFCKIRGCQNFLLGPEDEDQDFHKRWGEKSLRLREKKACKVGQRHFLWWWSLCCPLLCFTERPLEVKQKKSGDHGIHSHLCSCTYFSTNLHPTNYWALEWLGALSEASVKKLGSRHGEISFR